MQRLKTIGLAFIVAACGSQPAVTTPTPAPIPSVAADARDRGQRAVEAFLAAMADPDVTYRVVGQLRAGAEDEEGRPDVLVNTYFDVNGSDYGGNLDIHLRDPTVGGSFQLIVLDDTAHLWSSNANGTASMDAPGVLHRADAVQGLTADDLTLLGVTDEGDFEFAVAPWLGGDPLGEWVDLGAVPERALPHTELLWHDSRLFIDEQGAPQRLTSEWMAVTEESDEPVSGTILGEFEGMGMYVTLQAPEGFARETSHNIDGGPWRPIDPPEGGATPLDFVLAPTEQPIMLGIEGAIFFVRSHDEDGEMILDAIVGMGDGTVEIPIGQQTLVAYYRACDGNCARLGEAHDFCSVEADIRDGARYTLTVDVLGMHRAVPATCTVEETEN